MTQEEFVHKATSLRTKALTEARSFGLNEQAEDVAQDVMLKLWAMHESLKADDPLETYAAITAKHICIDQWRAKQKRSITLASQLGQTEKNEVLRTQSEADQHSQLEAKELEEWLQRQIDRLPSISGIVLRMRQIERRDLSEIAQLLGITQASVSTLLSRARLQLRKQLRELTS